MFGVPRWTGNVRSIKRIMNWFTWALLSAFFAGLTAVLAKVGVAHVNSNLATAIRTVVILIFAWSIAFLTNNWSISKIEGRTWIFLILSGIATGLSWLCYFRALQLGEASRGAGSGLVWQVVVDVAEVEPSLGCGTLHGRLRKA